MGLSFFFFSLLKANNVGSWYKWGLERLGRWDPLAPWAPGSLVARDARHMGHDSQLCGCGITIHTMTRDSTWSLDPPLRWCVFCVGMDGCHGMSHCCQTRCILRNIISVFDGYPYPRWNVAVAIDTNAALHVYFPDSGRCAWITTS